MSADIILADFRSKTYHKPGPIALERLAAEILEQVQSDTEQAEPVCDHLTTEPA